jgi:stage V sporulation protein G
MSTLNKVDANTGEIALRDLEIRVFPTPDSKSNVLAYASATIDGMFGVHGIAVVNGKNGSFVSMPQTKDTSGKYRDVFHPITSGVRLELNNAVLSEYAIAIDSLVAEKESTLATLRNAATAAKERPLADRSEAKETVKKHKSSEAEH